MVELRRLPPEPLQFHARWVIAPGLHDDQRGILIAESVSTETEHLGEKVATAAATWAAEIGAEAC
jgi:hypothetical protein